ncbi:MAG TPA: serine/threonine-protein kinase, partial [Kofleriaceae bacterium]|nr:serine/threonine-protein kinase [Kofleriaceae bacterium]
MEPGRVVDGTYVIRRRLAEGGSGTIYEADHTKLATRVAIKILDAVRRPSAESIERFRREALAASQLRHPHAVRVYDRGETEEGIPWIAMELLDGDTLDVWLAKNGPVSPARLLELLTPICEVVGEAHAKGIVHRDLKPQNIMLVPAGETHIAKVIDFGIAALHGDDSLTDPDLVSGTPRYMAPEQWQGLRHADARSDVYALAVIAYQCLTGKPPLEADTTLAWMNKHRYETPANIRGRAEVPDGVARAIMRALAKEPQRRPPDATAFLAELRAGMQAPRRLRRRPALLFGGILLAGAAASAVVVQTRDHGAKPAICGTPRTSLMPLAVGNSWTYRITSPSTGQADAIDKTITLDATGDEGGLKRGTRGFRLKRVDASGTANRWLHDTGRAVVWDHDEWFDLEGRPTRTVYYLPYRLRVEHSCDRTIVGAAWTEEYDAIEGTKTTHMVETWSVQAIDETVTV